MSDLLSPLLPAGAGAVMAGRQALQPGLLDYFPSPPCTGRAGAELIRRLDPFAATVHECAAGGGTLAFGLAETFGVFSTDIAPYPSLARPGEACWPLDDEALDYLSPEADGRFTADWVVTNPPFKHAGDFVRAGWRRARRGVAMLLRLQAIEGAARHEVFTRECPLTLNAPFAERMPMVADRWSPVAASATGYGWFLFAKPEAIASSPMRAAIAAAREHGCHLEQIIPPGTKRRLTRPEDVLRFGPECVAVCRAKIAALEAEIGEFGESAKLRGSIDGYVDEIAAVEALIAKASNPLFSTPNPESAV